jgi:2-polyprenyl-6-methoxyphenol hydroxylase-like FAD-dependent oxidoreductase
MRDGRVVVVGGGPAGSVTALELARSGVEVTVVERASFPRRKVCGEYLSPGTLAVLDALGVGADVRRLGQPIAGVRLTAGVLDPIDLPFEEPALAVARATLDALLLDAARGAGAEVVHARAEDLRFGAGGAEGVVIRDHAGTRHDLRAAVVVGADGTGSVVARRLGLARRTSGGRRFALGGHYAGFGVLYGIVEMFADEGGYFAINPLSEDCVNAMVVLPERLLAGTRTVDALVRERACELGRGLRSLDRVSRIGPRAAVGPLAFDVTGSVAHGALLVGDAAGTLDPFTGQGVFLAISGARAAARATLQVLRTPARARQALAAYERAQRRELGARRRLSALVTMLVRNPVLGRRVAARITSTPRAARALVAAVGGSGSVEAALAPWSLAALFL